MTLHDLQRVAHKMALLVVEHGDRLRVTNCGAGEKHLREAVVDTMEEAWAMVMGERNGREPLLKGNY